jgi:hypothetical protein
MLELAPCVSSLFKTPSPHIANQVVAIGSLLEKVRLDHDTFIT